MAEELYREGFASWLSAHDGIAVVGQARNDTSCPIAAWIDEEIGETVGVTPWLIEFYAGESLISLDPPPEWARCFINHIDDLLGDEEPVTARAALDTLQIC